MSRGKDQSHNSPATPHFWSSWLVQIASGLCSILKRLEISLTGPEKVFLGNNSKDFMHVEHLPDSLSTETELVYILSHY